MIKYACDKNKTHPNWYLDIADDPLSRSYELTCTNDSTWKISLEHLKTFCHDGSTECTQPASTPKCQDRSVLCKNTPIPYQPWLKQTLTTPGKRIELGTVYNFTCEHQGNFQF